MFKNWFQSGGIFGRKLRGNGRACFLRDSRVAVGRKNYGQRKDNRRRMELREVKNRRRCEKTKKLGGGGFFCSMLSQKRGVNLKC